MMEIYHVGAEYPPLPIEKGYEQTMAAMAYTWFNRLMALRYMKKWWAQ